jgi:hypothetical protein
MSSLFPSASRGEATETTAHTKKMRIIIIVSITAGVILLVAIYVFLQYKVYRERIGKKKEHRFDDVVPGARGTDIEMGDLGRALDGTAETETSMSQSNPPSAPQSKPNSASTFRPLPPLGFSNPPSARLSKPNSTSTSKPLPPVPAAQKPSPYLSLSTFPTVPAAQNPISHFSVSTSSTELHDNFNINDHTTPRPNVDDEKTCRWSTVSFDQSFHSGVGSQVYGYGRARHEEERREKLRNESLMSLEGNEGRK